MVPLNEITITDNNRQEFYQTVYNQQFFGKSSLVPLHRHPANQYVIVDCCGWYYQRQWPQHKILCIETETSVSSFNLDQTLFDEVINDKELPNIKWPTATEKNCILIFDHSPMLKYLDKKNFLVVLDSAAEHYQAKKVIVRINHQLLDDFRLQDRFDTLCQLRLINYVVSEFKYDELELHIVYKRKLCDAFGK